MHLIRWHWPRLRRAHAGALRSAGVALARPSAPVVCHLFSGSQTRTLPSGDPWLWLAARKVSPAAARDAVLAGAYAVVSQDEPGFLTALAARVAELAVPEPAPPAAQALVSKSPAARRVLEQLAHAARTSMPVLL